MKLKSYFREDENVLLLNTQYVPPMKDEATQKYSKGVLYLIYRDLDTREKKVRKIIDPESSTFITKPEYRTSFKTQRKYIEDYKVDRYDVRYWYMTKFIRDMVKEDGRDTEYLKICDYAPKEVFKWRHTYFADYNICDYAMISYLLENNCVVPDTNISAAFLDIEGDVYGLTSSEVDEASYPINAVSVVIPFDEKGRKFKHPNVFTFLLRNHIRYKQQEYFEDHLDEFIKECHEEFDDKYDKPNFIINVYDDEVKMLRSLFAVLHKLSPDFILIWNMGYDIPTIIKRLIVLGENPMNYFCHPDFETGYFRYNYDNIYKNDFKNKCESFDCTSYSLWCDQMLNYAGVRKSKSDYGGNSLDNVAGIELKAEKRKYDKKTVNVLNGAIEEYWNFVKYSINDVLLQYGIDKKTNDLQALFEQSLFGGTRFSKTLKQSVYLKNVFAIDYFNTDIVPGNNCNVNYEKYKDEERAVTEESYLSGDSYDDIDLPGALVGDPTLNMHTGVCLFGIPSNSYFKYAYDLDFGALYPNSKITANIAAHTQYGRIIAKEQVIENENPNNDPKFIRAGKLINDYETDDTSIVARWIGIKPMIKYIKEYIKKRLFKK